MANLLFYNWYNNHFAFNKFKGIKTALLDNYLIYNFFRNVGAKGVSKKLLKFLKLEPNIIILPFCLIVGIQYLNNQTFICHKPFRHARITRFYLQFFHKMRFWYFPGVSNKICFQTRY